MKDLIVVTQAATLLGISNRRVYELARHGLLPVVHLGPRQVRFSVRAVEAWIASGGLARVNATRPS